MPNRCSQSLPESSKQQLSCGCIRCSLLHMLGKALASMLLALSTVSGLLYKPAIGAIWDPSCFALPNGTYYCVCMYRPSSSLKSLYTSGFLPRSADGVNWSDVGHIAPSGPGLQWFKRFVLTLKDIPEPLFVLNHGVDQDEKQSALRTLTSSDLLNWTMVGTSQPDSRWYTRPATTHSNAGITCTCPLTLWSKRRAPHLAVYDNT